MRLIEITRALRGTLAVVMLAPFLIGGNHCLIGALRHDTTMRCLQMVPEAAPAKAHGCCHGGEADGAAKSDAALSCCIVVGPVPADVAAAAPAHADLFAIPVETTGLEVTPAPRVRPVAIFLSPPEAPPGAPRSSRAPPLA